MEWKGQGDHAGISLTDLMVAIVLGGILTFSCASGFRDFELKAKIAKAKIDLRAIRTIEISYFAENGFYVPVDPYPNGTPGTTPMKWHLGTAGKFAILKQGSKGSFADFSFSPAEPVGQSFYQYAVDTYPDDKAAETAAALGGGSCPATPKPGIAAKVDAKAQGFVARATGDLDGNGKFAQFTISEFSSITIHECAPGEY